jgi:hypothetical protein
MKYQLLILIILTLNTLTSAQEFAPLNAKWHFEDCYFDVNGPITYSIIKTVGDTIIDERYSTIIHLYGDNGQTFVTGLIVHEDQGKVYFHEAEEFRLFFDYNLKAGDTLAYRVPVNAPYFQSNCGGAEVDPDRTYYALITEITSLEADGKELLVFNTSILRPDDDYFYVAWELEVFTQRIGSPHGLFGRSEAQVLGGFPGVYRCYEDDEISINFSPTVSCDFTTVNISDNVNNTKITIYPNPAGHFIKIRNFVDNCSLIELTDVNGRILKSKAIESTTETNMNLSDIPPGIYFIRMKCNGLTNTQGKIVRISDFP